MTKKERKYLRAAYHHFKFLEQKSSPEATQIAKRILASPVMHSIVFNVLCLEGDEDGQVEDALNDIFKENKIEFL